MAVEDLNAEVTIKSKLVHHAEKHINGYILLAVFCFVIIVNCFIWRYLSHKTRRETTTDMN